MPSDPRFKRCLLGTALILFTVLGAGSFVLLRPVNPDALGHVPFAVSRGEGITEIAGQLEEKGLIKSAIGFTLYALIRGSATGFKPGAYSLSPVMSGPAIARTLEAGAPAITVTLPEGSTLVDMDRILASKGVIGAGDLIEYDRKNGSSLEGFLFPDTYIFSGGTKVGDVVHELVGNFEKNIGPLLSGMGEEERVRIATIASLIEKEALYPHDRLMVSGVIAHRLSIGMRLQLDAANVYVKCGGAYVTCPAKERRLSTADLGLKSPYNLYLNAGLPPGPIASAGKDAFAAAIRPKKTVNLYYISNPATGRLIFAETLDGHNANRGKYHIN